MTDWAQIFTGWLFYAHVEIHKLWRLVFDNYQKCPLPSISDGKIRFYLMGDFQDAWWQQTYQVKSIVLDNVRTLRTT